jgi:hypothetical protein
MNHELALTLELLSQSETVLQFQLGLHNRSATSLLIPRPQITDLNFRNSSTQIAAQWYTHLLQSKSWASLLLKVDEKTGVRFDVRPCSVSIGDSQRYEGLDYCRWCLDLSAGEYFVGYTFAVDEKYFCGDSHYRFKDVLREAEAQQAVAWIGSTSSNEVLFERV